MNENHARVCGGPEWAEFVQTELLPGFLTDIELGPEMLELGPGPGATTRGSDSLASERLHHFHADDVYNPIEPGTLLTRLQTLGFARVTVILDERLRFVARKNPVATDE